MITFAIYSLKSVFTLTVLYLPFVALLERETFFRFNRGLLVGILFLSLVLPFVNIPWLAWDINKMIDIQLTLPDSPAGGIIADAPDAFTVSIGWITQSRWMRVMQWILVLGLYILFLIRLVQIAYLYYWIKKSTIWKRKQRGIWIHCCRGNFSPFSWMNRIIVNEEDGMELNEDVLLHEEGHIVHLHSWDMLLLLFVQAIQWFNPFIWLFSRSLSDVHEYEADAYVLSRCADIREYQRMLLMKANPSLPYVFVNHLRFNQLKGRIIRMNSSLPHDRMKWKAVYLLLAAIIPVCMFSQSLEIIPSASTEASFPGGTNALIQFITSHQEYPQEALEAGVQGRVVVDFDIEEDGSLSHIRAISIDDRDCSQIGSDETEVWQLIHQAEHNVEIMPHWVPAQQNGKAVSSHLQMAIIFRYQ